MSHQIGGQALITLGWFLVAVGMYIGNYRDTRWLVVAMAAIAIAHVFVLGALVGASK